MLTCKDCLCYEACNYHITEETTFTVNECATGFKNKDEYIRLPAYIGQPVFILGSNHKYMDGKFTLAGWEVREGKVSMLQQKADKSWKFRVTINSSVGDYTLDEVGTDIFFSGNEAITECNKRLKELNLCQD